MPLDKSSISLILLIVTLAVAVLGFVFISIAKAIDNSHEINMACIEPASANTPMCLKRAYAR